MKDKGVPAGTWCPHIEASNHDPSTAYAVFDDHRRSNWTPYVFMTTDFGETWKSIATPVIDGFIHVIREDPVEKNLLFLGTEFGLYVSFDQGKEWTRWTSGLPTVPIRDMVIHPLDNDLVIGTHGRSVYILDDIQPLREINESIKAKRLHLFQVADAYQFRTSFFSFGYLAPGNMEFQGQNRPYGAIITYSVGNPPPDSPKEEEQAAAKDADVKEQIEIAILDNQGEVIRTIKGPKNPGLNRINWDLRRDPFKTLRDPFEGFFPQTGPFVLPGTYKVRIELDDVTVEDSLQVLPDPRHSVSQASRRAKFNLIMENGKYIEAVTVAYKTIQENIEALDEVLKRIDQLEEKRREYIRIKATEFRKRLKGYADRLSPPKDRAGIFEETELADRLATLSSRMESSFDEPTTAQRLEFQNLKAAVHQELYIINRFFKEDFPRFIQEVKNAGFSIFPKIEPITIKQ
jgi:hypothetical protein